MLFLKLINLSLPYRANLHVHSGMAKRDFSTKLAKNELQKPSSYDRLQMLYYLKRGTFATFAESYLLLPTTYL
jgi:hypothetical protein